MQDRPSEPKAARGWNELVYHPVVEATVEMAPDGLVHIHWRDEDRLGQVTIILTMAQLRDITAKALDLSMIAAPER